MMRDACNTESAPYGIRNVGNSSNYNPLRQSGNSRQAILHQLYQSNQLYCGYLKSNKKGVYQVDNEAMKDQSESFYTIFDADGEDITYLDKSFDKLIVNFIGIETFCLKCHSSFPLKSKLYKHIKAGCVGEALPSFSTQLFLSIPVIISMAVHQSFGLSLAFKG